MTRRSRPTVLVLSLVLFAAAGMAGCASSNRVEEGEPTAKAEAPPSPQVYSRAVYVLVDGKEKGMVPATIRVRRGMGARMVSLWQAGKELRTFELQTIQTADGLSMTYSFFGEQTESSTVYDTSTLPTAGENNYIVPYSPHRLTIEDRKYRLTLIVEE